MFLSAPIVSISSAPLLLAYIFDPVFYIRSFYSAVWLCVSVWVCVWVYESLREIGGVGFTTTQSGSEGIILEMLVWLDLFSQADEFGQRRFF